MPASLGLWSGGAPSLSTTTVARRNYSLPPGAVQKDGGATRITTNDVRLLNAIFSSAGGVLRLWTAHTSAFGWPGNTKAIEPHGDAARSIRRIRQAFFFPVIQADNAHITFGRSATDEYGQFRQTGRLVSDAPNNPQGSALVMAGQAPTPASDGVTTFGYQEYATGGHLVDNQDVVRLLCDLHDSLCSQALDADDSLARITELTQQAE